MGRHLNTGATKLKRWGNMVRPTKQETDLIAVREGGDTNPCLRVLIQC